MSEIHLARRSERNISLLALHFMQIITIHQRKNNLVESDGIKLSLFFLFRLPGDVRSSYHSAPLQFDYLDIQTNII
jgi:hypothetical protein